MNLAQIMKRLDSIAGGTDKAMQRAVKQTTLQMAADARQKAMHPDESQNTAMNRSAGRNSGPSGALARSITSSVEGSGKEILGKITCNAPYGAYVEFGTGPVGEKNHAGTSPNMKVTYAQSFYVKSGRNKGKARVDETGTPYWVYHDEDGFHATSGQPARPFMYPAMKENEGTLLAALKSEIRRLLKKG